MLRKDEMVRMMRERSGRSSDDEDEAVEDEHKHHKCEEVQ